MNAVLLVGNSATIASRPPTEQHPHEICTVQLRERPVRNSPPPRVATGRPPLNTQCDLWPLEAVHDVRMPTADAKLRIPPTIHTATRLA